MRKDFVALPSSHQPRSSARGNRGSAGGLEGGVRETHSKHFKFSSPSSGWGVFAWSSVPQPVVSFLLQARVNAFVGRARICPTVPDVCGFMLGALAQLWISPQAPLHTATGVRLGAWEACQKPIARL